MTETLGLVIYIIGVLSFGVLGEILINTFFEYIEHTAEEVTEKPSTDMMTWYTEPPEEAKVGDVYVDLNEMTVYCFTGQEWKPIQEIDARNRETDKSPENCKNCGAPLTGHVCEYCGSVYE